jgi:hypothetical protein
VKLVYSALVVALASSVVSAAPPQSTNDVQPQAEQALPPMMEKILLARRYISLAVSPDQFIESVRSGATQTMLASLDDQDGAARADGAKDIEHLLSLMEPKIRERIPNLLEAYSVVYAREFSADELRQMIAFAQSPVGRHYLSRQLELDTDPIIQRQEEGFAADLLPILHQIQKEKCAKRAAQRIAMGDKNAKCALSSEPETAAG